MLIVVILHSLGNNKKTEVPTCNHLKPNCSIPKRMLTEGCAEGTVGPEGCEVGASTAGSLFSAVLWTQRRTACVANSSFPFGNFLEFNFFPTRFEQWAAELVPRCALPSHVGRDRRTEERQSNVTQN
jgi:hypothetical protein